MIATSPSPPREEAAAGFLVRLLAREGALVQAQGPDRLFAVLPDELQAALELPESASLRLLGRAAAGETAFPLECAGMQWCVERAASRGRLAAVRFLVPAHEKPAASMLKSLTALNGTLRAVRTRIEPLAVWLLEFRYEACAEERAQGSVFLALEAGLGAVSRPLAGAILDALPRAEPAALPPELPDFPALARRVEGLARGEILDRLAPFRRTIRRRLAADRERLLAYHETLLAEATRRRRRGAAGPGPATAEDALRDKVAAIARDRDRKLAELFERHSARVRYALSSALLATYDASVCEVRLRRRRREIPIRLAWDPLLHAPLPHACDACGRPAPALHACDAHGHLTCASCAARCPTCGRVTCRVCRTAGCRVCG